MEWNGGSPIAKGTFHWEMYDINPAHLSGMFDWESLKSHIQTFGVCNSHVVALMPTASTSQLLGNNECFEPYTSNVYKRDTSAGEFIVINKYLINDLYNSGLWNNNLKEYLIASEGSIQNIEGIPEFIKALYKTAWEIDPSVLIQQCIERQPYVDQMISFNLYIRDFTLTKWNKCMFMAWRGRLKTGKYYLHTEAAVMPTKFTIDPSKQKEMAVLLEKNKPRTEFLSPLREVCDACTA
jgi:ribonucleotide reductase alpha subunit